MAINRLLRFYGPAVSARGPRRRWPASPAAAALVALGCSVVRPALAQADEAARLRREGNDYFKQYVTVAARGQGDPSSPVLAKACQKYEASLEKRDSVELRMNLASCYGAMRKPRQAYEHVLEAEKAAQIAAGNARNGAEARALLEEVKRERERIFDNSAHLKVVVGAPESSGLVVFYDGTPLPREQWGKELVIDEGEHEVAAEAPDLPRWSTKVLGRAKTPTHTVVPPLHKAPSSPELANFCGGLKATYDSQPNLRALMSLANCHSAMGKYETAAQELSEVQSEAREQGQPQLLDEAKREQARLARVAPQLTIDARAADQPGLAIYLDGKPLSREQLGRPLVTDIGEHEVAAKAPNTPRWATKVRSSAPALSVVVPRLLPDASTASAPGPLTPSRKPPIVGYAVGGLGVAALGAGLVSGALAYSSYKRSTDACPERQGCSDRAVADRDRAETQATIANVAVPVGIAASALGAYMIFFAPSKSKPEATHSVRAGLLLTPNSAGLTLGGSLLTARPRSSIDGCDRE